METEDGSLLRNFKNHGGLKFLANSVRPLKVPDDQRPALAAQQLVEAVHPSVE